MITLSHVYKTYRGSIPALKDISLSIAKGEFVFLTGPSGAGKSTLFKIICAYDRPTSGSAQITGYKIEDITSDQASTLRRQIGVVYQDFKLLRDRTVFENVALPLRIAGETTQQIQRRVRSVLEEVGLRYKSDDLPEHLSGGEQQRVSIARAIVHRPNILVADEPTGNLDPELSAEILNLFETVNSQGTTVVLATHDLSLVKSRGHRRIHLSAGCIEREFHGSTEAVP